LDPVTKPTTAFGFILRNVDTGELCYYHSSQNNSRFLDVPHLIRNEEDLNTSEKAEVVCIRSVGSSYQTNDSFVLQNMVWKDDSGTNGVQLERV
jgi:hypothetical protein